MTKWDLYDAKFKKINKVINSEEIIEDGYYHLSLNIWIINSSKQVLLVKKALNYKFHYPGLYGSININVASGIFYKEAAIMELKNKLGLNIQLSDIKEIDMQLRDPYHYIYKTIVIEKDFSLELIKLNTLYYTSVKWADFFEITKMIDNGEIASVLISRIKKYIIPLIK